MPPRSRADAAALTDDDVASLRARVAAGDKPRVVVRAASAAVPAGTKGNVVRIGEPTEGEFIVVRLGRDEVPFAPNELAVPGRARATTAAASPAAAGEEREEPSTPGPPAARARRTPKRGTAAPASTTPQPARQPAPQPARRQARARAGATRTPSPLAVTLRFAGGDWTVEAQRGARRVGRPTPLRPGAVTALAELVDDEAVREALIETVESCRAVVEERAEALRAELAAAEAALRDYDARRR